MTGHTGAHTHTRIYMLASSLDAKLTFPKGKHKWLTYDINWNKSCKKKHTWHLLAIGGSAHQGKSITSN